MDRYLRDVILAFQPLDPNQHAYQAGKSVETALHQLLVRVEKALDQQEIALGVFLDIEGAFDNNSYDFMCSDIEQIRPLYDGLEPPWRVGWPWRLSGMPLGVSGCPGVALREEFYHPSYGALL